MSTLSMLNESVFQRRPELVCLSFLISVFKSAALLLTIFFMLGVVRAQTFYQPIPGDNPYVVEGVSETIVYTVGHSSRINGTAKKGEQ